VLAILRRSNVEHGTTVVLVTHDQEVGEACDRVIRVRDGIIRAIEPVRPATIIREEQPIANRPELQPVG
jgi:ABC-type lipoprotein export system ATPase subunit